MVAFSVRPDGDDTIVTVTADYKFKYGPIGALLDWLILARRLRKGMAGLLAGLKYYVETGHLVGDQVPTVPDATS